MAGSLNLVHLIGRLGRDPEMKYTGSGTPFCRFSIATDESYTPKGGEKKTVTEWHNIVVWDKLAEICSNYLKKGRQVYISGKLQTREWDDQDGNKRKSTEIVAKDMVMLGDRRDGDGGGDRSERSDRPPSARSTPSPSAPPDSWGDGGGGSGGGNNGFIADDSDVPF